MTKSEIATEALDRATQGQSFANYPAIFQGFMARGIPESEIAPRENVLTFHAWRAKGRTVKRGEHGVKVITWIPVKDKETGEVTGKRAKTAVVFHVTQTVELGAEDKPAPRYTEAQARELADHSDESRYCVRDPGELAADRWNETHGDRWIEA